MKSILNFKNVIVFSAILLVASMTMPSCSKTVRLEKRLDGTWLITTYDMKEYVNGTYDASNSGVESNVGEFVFERKKGTNTGTLTFFDPSGNLTLAITDWSNTEDKVTMTITLFGSETWVWAITTNEKKQQVWTRTDIYDDFGDTIKDDIIMTLTKK